MQVMRVQPQTYPDALHMAQNEYSVLQLARVTELGAAPAGEEPMEIGALGPNGRAPIKGNCHFCQKPGHFKRDCYLYKKASSAAGQAKTGGYNNASQNRGRPNGGRGQKGGRQALLAALAATLLEEDEEGAGQSQEGEVPVVTEEGAENF